MAAPIIQAFERVEDVLHQKARLGIMAMLASMGEASFVQLKEALELTDGNLSSHISTLEKAGYLAVEKSFRGKRPHTRIRATDAGERAFHQYLAALEQVIAEAKDMKR